MKRKPFTLLELSAAMAVLMIFMLFVMRFYNASQDVMNRSTSKTDQFERARVIMDLLASDLQSIYYTEGLSTVVYNQTNTGSGSGANTTSLAFPVLRPYTQGNTKTDLAFVTYHYDTDNYELKMGVADEDHIPASCSPLASGSLGTLAEGVVHFRVAPHKRDESEITTLTEFTSASTGARRIPDYVQIELELMDGDSVEAYKNAVKVFGSDKVPDALKPSSQAVKDKCRSFFRIVEIDRGQY